VSFSPTVSLLISSPLRDCVASKDAEVRTKVSPFGKGGLRGILSEIETAGDWENLPWPLFSKEGES